MPTLRGSAALVGLTLVTFSCGGRGGPGDGGDPRDIRGNYAIRYDNSLKLTIYLGGAVRTVNATTDAGVVNFGYIDGQPVTLDLNAYCARPEVVCPSEAFWSRVAIDQPNLSQNNFDLQVLTVIDDTVHTLDAGQKANATGGLVDHANADRYLIGLGLNGGATQNCAALAVSFSDGRFTHAGETVSNLTVYRTPGGEACNPDGGSVDGGARDAGNSDGGVTPCNATQVQQITVPPGAAVNGIADGKVELAWAGGCAFGPVLAGAVLVAETGYTGTRTGAYDPPPYTPAPVVQPDGGLPQTDGGAIPTGCDGGNADGGC